MVGLILYGGGLAMMPGLQYFSFTELWSPLFLALMLLLTAGYFVLIGPLASRFEGSTAVPFWRRGCSYAECWPSIWRRGTCQSAGAYPFSFHMVSMALSYLVAVPLIMLGIPDWCWRALLRVNPLRGLAFWLSPSLPHCSSTDYSRSTISRRFMIMSCCISRFTVCTTPYYS